MVFIISFSNNIILWSEYKFKLHTYISKVSIGKIIKKWTVPLVPFQILLRLRKTSLTWTPSTFSILEYPACPISPFKSNVLLFLFPLDPHISRSNYKDIHIFNISLCSRVQGRRKRHLLHIDCEDDSDAKRKMSHLVSAESG